MSQFYFPIFQQGCHFIGNLMQTKLHFSVYLKPGVCYVPVHLQKYIQSHLLRRGLISLNDYQYLFFEWRFFKEVVVLLWLPVARTLRRLDQKYGCVWGLVGHSNTERLHCCKVVNVSHFPQNQVTRDGQGSEDNDWGRHELVEDNWQVALLLGQEGHWIDGITPLWPLCNPRKAH